MGRPLYAAFEPVIAMPQEKTPDLYSSRDVEWNPEGYTDAEWDRMAQLERFVDMEQGEGGEQQVEQEVEQRPSGRVNTGSDSSDLTGRGPWANTSGHPYAEELTADMDMEVDDDIPALEDVSDFSSSSSDSDELASPSLGTPSEAGRTTNTSISYSRPHPIESALGSGSLSNRNRRTDTRAESLQTLTRLSGLFSDIGSRDMVPEISLATQDITAFLDSDLPSRPRRVARNHHDTTMDDFASESHRVGSDTGAMEDVNTAVNNVSIHTARVPTLSDFQTFTSRTSQISTATLAAYRRSTQITRAEDLGESNIIGEALDLDLDFDDGATTRHQIVGLRTRDRGESEHTLPRLLSDFEIQDLQTQREARAPLMSREEWAAPLTLRLSSQDSEHRDSGSEPISIPLRPSTPPRTTIPFSSSYDTIGAPSPAPNVTPRVYSWARSRRLSSSAGVGPGPERSPRTALPPTIGSLRIQRAAARV